MENSQTRKSVIGMREDRSCGRRQKCRTFTPWTLCILALCLFLRFTGGQASAPLPPVPAGAGLVSLVVTGDVDKSDSFLDDMKTALATSLDTVTFQDISVVGIDWYCPPATNSTSPGPAPGFSEGIPAPQAGRRLLALPLSQEMAWEQGELSGLPEQDTERRRAVAGGPVAILPDQEPGQVLLAGASRRFPDEAARGLPEEASLPTGVPKQAQSTALLLGDAISPADGSGHLGLPAGPSEGPGFGVDTRLVFRRALSQGPAPGPLGTSTSRLPPDCTGVSISLLLTPGSPDPELKDKVTRLVRNGQLAAQLERQNVKVSALTLEQWTDSGGTKEEDDEGDLSSASEVPAGVLEQFVPSNAVVFILLVIGGDALESNVELTEIMYNALADELNATIGVTPADYVSQDSLTLVRTQQVPGGVSPRDVSSVLSGGNMGGLSLGLSVTGRRLLDAVPLSGFPEDQPLPAFASLDRRLLAAVPRRTSRTQSQTHLNFTMRGRHFLRGPPLPPGVEPVRFHTIFGKKSLEDSGVGDANLEAWGRGGFTRLRTTAEEGLREVNRALGIWRRGGGGGGRTDDGTGGTKGGIRRGFRGRTGDEGAPRLVAARRRKQPRPVTSAEAGMPPKEQHGLWASRLASLGLASQGSNPCLLPTGAKRANSRCRRRTLLEVGDFPEYEEGPGARQSGRNLQQLLAAPAAADDKSAFISPRGNSSLPALFMKFRVSDIPVTNIPFLKQQLLFVVGTNELLSVVQDAGQNISAINFFGFQAGNASIPDLAGVSSGESGDGGTSLYLIVLAAILPVLFMGLLVGGGIMWWNRRKRHRAIPSSHADLKLQNGGLSAISEDLFTASRATKAGSDNLNSLSPFALSPPGSDHMGLLSGRTSLPGGPDSDRSELATVIDTLKERSLRTDITGQSMLEGIQGLQSDWQIDPAELQILKKPDGSEWELGSGAAGRVFKAVRNGVQIVAVKIFTDQLSSAACSAQYSEELKREIFLLRSCHDRNIVQFLGAHIGEGNTILVTEFMENGDLFRCLQNDKMGRFSWYRRMGPNGKAAPMTGMARRIALDIARGLHFLHSRKIVHFDLKSANILLARDWTAKLADVGLSKILKNEYLSTLRAVGTFCWSAPEILLGKPCTEKVDIYSYGVVLWELSVGEAPSGRSLRQLRVPEECPAEVEAFINRCLDPDPSKRPSAKDLVDFLVELDPGNAPEKASTLQRRSTRTQREAEQGPQEEAPAPAAAPRPSKLEKKISSRKESGALSKPSSMKESQAESSAAEGRAHADSELGFKAGRHPGAALSPFSQQD
eukprot:jgi/Botrbrau1/3135/Bobra.0070s0107.2